MSVEEVISQLPDRSLRQLVFFYELCKSGVVCFDMCNAAHVELLARMRNLIEVELIKKNSIQACKDAEYNLWSLILFQIKHHVK